MGQFQTVLWQEDDEVTSEKLQQMSDNLEYLKSNLIIGENSWPANPLGSVADGRQSVILGATKFEAVRMNYDSQVPVDRMTIEIPFPPVFTEPPIVTVSICDNFNFAVVHITPPSARACAAIIAERNGQTVQLQGQISVMALGR